MKNVQDIYPVSPMQEMMLLHALAQNDSDTLFNQFCFQIDADLDVTAFRNAWCRIIDRHDALRTSFIWEGIKQPQQVVRKSVSPEFMEMDWRALASAEQEERFAKHLAEDHSRGFDPRRAPLLRFSIIRTGEQSWRFVWSSHHLIVDRWCLGALFAELDRYYFDPGRDGDAPEDAAPPSFREYIAWVQGQDRAAAIAFWTAALRGFRTPMRLVPERAETRAGSASAASAETLQVPASIQAEVAAFVTKHGMTSSAVLQGAWALTLNRIAQTQDAVFGATVAGRPPEIPGVESIVGSFINNVPVRVQMLPETGVLEWLKGIQAAQFQRTPFEYLAPGDIERCSEVAESVPLFDTLLVSVSGDNRPAGLAMRPMSPQYATAYPLTLSIAENEDGIMLRADSNGDCVRPLPELLHEFRSSLQSLLEADGSTALGELPGFCQDASFVALPAGSAHPGSARAKPESPGSTPIDGAARAREQLGTDALQEMLRGEWAAVLGHADLHPDADFFELGGTSLQAARLHALIERSTRQALPLLTLFQTPTISGMARTLYDGDWPLLAETTVGLRTAGGGIPLFCIASPEVNTVGYSMLARHLPDSQDVYVLQEPPDTMQFRQLNPSAIPALAGRYVQCMRDIQPTGPYYVLSMCDGSHIALEIARTLEADNETIGFFGIINTWGLYTISRLYYVNRFINVLRYYAGRIRELIPQRGAADDVAHDHAQGQQASALPAESTVGVDNPWIRDVGFENCDPGRPKITTEITVFRIKPQPFWRIRDPQLGWSKQASSVRVVYLSCDDHYAIMRKQHIRQLAGSIEAQLVERGGAPALAKSA